MEVNHLSFWSCLTPACAERQQKWSLVTTAGQGLYVPLPRQVEALEAVASQQYRWILFGGARGGGKSRFLRWLAYLCCLTHPDFRVLLLRRTYPELEKSHMRWVGAESAKLNAEFVPSAKPPVLRFPNGSLLEFGHCQDAQDVENYLSAEYHLLCPDELGTFEEDMILRIASSVRLYLPTFRPCVVAATNPGSRWVKRRWIDRSVDAQRYPNYDPSQYCFIPSLLDDNPYPDPEYEAFLDALDPDTRAAWRNGSWDVFEGQYFKEFRRDYHVRSMEIPAELPRLGGLDWGFLAPGCMLWGVCLPDGRLHIEREMVFRETLAAAVATTIQAYGPTQTIYADPSMWIRSGQTGESIAETMLRQGVPLQRANHERCNGWQRLRHWLRRAEEQTAWLTIDPQCTYLLQTLPSLCHDRHRPEDVDTDGPDHAADALRYLVMGRPAPALSPVILAAPDPFSVGALWQQAKQASTQSPLLGAANLRS